MHYNRQSESSITKKEMMCLRYAASDMTIKETSERMNLSIRTIKTHRSNVLRKLSKNTMTAAVLYAYKAGYFEFTSE